MLKAAPGIYLVEPFKEKNKLNLGTPKERKILKGIIVDVGENRDHDQGGKLISTLKAGTTIFFLNYAEHYDEFEEEGKTYYAVLFNDARAYIE